MKIERVQFTKPMTAAGLRSVTSLTSKQFRIERKSPHWVRVTTKEGHVYEIPRERFAWVKAADDAEAGEAGTGRGSEPRGSED